MSSAFIPFSYQHYYHEAFLNTKNVLESGKSGGNGPWTQQAEHALTQLLQAHSVVLVNSASAALEISAHLLNLQPGDEIIVPSYTFVTSASSFALHGATPVFVDIALETGNLAVPAVLNALTPKTRAIVAVHYAGIACDLKALSALPPEIQLIEDAAQGIGAYHQQQALGTIGDMGVMSFHHTKNIACGEGGALIVKQVNDRQIAEMIREKGTDRSQFLRGEIDKYTWQCLGHSFCASEFQAAILCGQLQHTKAITDARILQWGLYHELLCSFEQQGHLFRPLIPAYAQHNGHFYFIRLMNASVRAQLKAYLFQHGIEALTHYVPLHLSPAGLKYGRVSGALPNTINFYETLLRLPIHPHLVDLPFTIAHLLEDFFKNI